MSSAQSLVDTALSDYQNSDRSEKNDRAQREITRRRSEGKGHACIVRPNKGSQTEGLLQILFTAIPTVEEEDRLILDGWDLSLGVMFVVDVTPLEQIALYKAVKTLHPVGYRRDDYLNMVQRLWTRDPMSLEKVEELVREDEARRIREALKYNTWWARLFRQLRKQRNP